VPRNPAHREEALCRARLPILALITLCILLTIRELFIVLLLLSFQRAAASGAAILAAAGGGGGRGGGAQCTVAAAFLILILPLLCRAQVRVLSITAPI
jgi:hypothetical protein